MLGGSRPSQLARWYRKRVRMTSRPPLCVPSRGNVLRGFINTSFGVLAFASVVGLNDQHPGRSV
ncbi:hypothetical protein RSAG8_09031, partial [Rhizoctonia solani AG-8 WAC10335]